MSYSSVENILKVEGVKAKGFGIIPKIAMQDIRLTIEAKAIYSYFCSYAGAGTTAFPSVKKIIADLKISKDRYYRHFDLLKKYGYIKTKQKNIKGKFNQNIYTLVEKPMEVAIEEPYPQNKESIDFPNPHFKDTENKDTDEPRPYFMDTQNANTENKDSNINSIYKINNSLKSSVNLSIEEQNEGLIPDELSIIFDKCELALFNDDERSFIVKAIEELYFSKGERINDRIINQEQIRQELSKLKLNILDYALRKFKETQNTRKIKNLSKYFRVLLFNSIDEERAENIRIKERVTNN